MKLKMIPLLFLLIFTKQSFSYPRYMMLSSENGGYQFELSYQEQKSQYLLNEIDFSNNHYSITNIYITKKIEMNHVEIFLQFGFGNHQSSVSYLQASSISGQQISEVNQSFQNPKIYFVVPVSLYSDENSSTNIIKDYLYFQLTPAFFDQNSTIKNTRLIDGNSFDIGYFRWLEMNSYGYFVETKMSFGEKVIDSATNKVLSKNDQNTQVSFGLLGHLFPQNRDLMIVAQYNQQLDKIINSSSGGQTVSQGFDSTTLTVQYAKTLFGYSTLFAFDWQSIPVRIFKSGDYNFKIKGDTALNIRFSFLL